MADLNTDVRYLKGIGEKKALSLNRLGVFSLCDLISFFPRRYEDRSVFKPIMLAENGESVLAVQSGEITKVDKDELWGVKVELSCPGDLKVIYSGIADGSEPKKGDKVKKGDVLGKAGLLPIESADGGRASKHMNPKTPTSG